MRAHRKKRILIATGIFPPDTGGPATYCQKMALELLRRGWDVRVLTYADKGTINGAHLYAVHRVVRNGRAAWRYFKYFCAVLWFGRSADMIFVLDTLSAGYPVYLANKFLRKRVVVRVVGDHSWEQAQRTGLTNKLLDDFQEERRLSGYIGTMRKLQSRVARGAEHIITPSKYLKSIVQRWGVNPNKIGVVYNAVEIPGDLPDKTEARKRMALKKSDFLVVSVGRDVPWKGFDVLRAAVAELNTDIEKVNLKIYSSSPRSEVLTALQAADAFVLNTSYEGFSHVLLEALALGTPIITTAVGGNKEVIEDGENGLFVPVDGKGEIQEAIMKFYNDPALRKKLSLTAQETAKKFTVERMVNETEGVLKEIYN